MISLLAKLRVHETDTAWLRRDGAEHVQRRLSWNKEAPEQIEGDLIVLEERCEVVERARVGVLEISEEMREMAVCTSERGVLELAQYLGLQCLGVLEELGKPSEEGMRINLGERLSFSARGLAGVRCGRRLRTRRGFAVQEMPCTCPMTSCPTFISSGLLICRVVVTLNVFVLPSRL